MADSEVTSDSSYAESTLGKDDVTTEEGAFELVQEGPLFPWEKPVGLTCCGCLSFAFQCVLNAAQGSFLFGFNLSLLNSAIRPIKVDMEWCRGDEPAYAKDISLFSNFPDFNQGIDHNYPWCEAYISCDSSLWYEAFINTGVFVGAAAGSLTGGNFLVLGRRNMILLFNVVFTIGIFSSIFAGTFASLLWARLIVGYAVGLASFIVPMYIAEVSPKEKRGSYGVIHQLGITIGIFIGILFGLAFADIPGGIDDANPDVPCGFECVEGDGPDCVDSAYDADTCDNFATDKDKLCSYQQEDFDKIWWRVMLGIGIIPVCISFYLYTKTYAFETPNYYVERRREKDAEALIKKLNDGGDATEQISDIRNGIEEQKKAKEAGLGLCAAMGDSEYRFVILTGILLSAFQQFSGINVLIAASNALFLEAGLTQQMATTMSTVMTFINVLMTFPAIYLVEKLGRKTLMMIGTVGQCLGCLPAAIMYIVDGDTPSDTSNYLALVGAILFIVFFAVAYGPVLWVFLFEIYPPEIRGSAAGAATAMNWIASIVMVFSSPFFNNKWTFIIFSGMSFVAFLIVFFMMKETKGRSIENSPYFKKNR